MKIWQGLEQWPISLIAWIRLTNCMTGFSRRKFYTWNYVKFYYLWRKIAPSLSKLTKHKIKNALFLEKFPPSAKLWSQRFHLWVNYISKVIECSPDQTMSVWQTYCCPKLTPHTNEEPFISWVLLKWFSYAVIYSYSGEICYDNDDISHNLRGRRGCIIQSESPPSPIDWLPLS